MGQTGVEDQNMVGSGRRRDQNRNGPDRSRRSEHGWVRQEKEIRTGMGQAGE